MSQPLFRPEVLASQSARWAGSVIVLQPVSAKLAAMISAVLAIAIAYFAATGFYTRKVTVSGRVVPKAGAVKAVAPQFGRVILRGAKEGDLVREGQVLFELSSERTTKEGGVEQRVLAALAERRNLLKHEAHLQTAQLRQRQQDLRMRQQLLSAESGAADKERQLQERRQVLVERSLHRYQVLREQGFISEMQVTQAEVELADQHSRVQAAQRSKLAFAKELAQVAADLSQVEAQIQLGVVQMDRTLAALDQETIEQKGRGESRILAPASGVVTALGAELGDSVAAGAVVATIIPREATFEAHLMAPSNAIGLVAEDQFVRLRVAAFPYQKFGYLTGRIRSIELGPLAEASPAPSAKPEAVYRIVVRLDRQSIAAYGQQKSLKAGMALEADIKQDKRRLIEWIFDPIKSAVSAPAF